MSVLPARRREWPAPVALVLLSVVPLVAGTLRLVQLAGGPDLMPADARFAASPAPLVLHLLGSAVFTLLGAVQLVPRVRRNHPAWHRRVGRGVALAGLVVAATATWMTLTYARHPGTGELLYLMRLVVAPAMAACLVLGVVTVRRGDLAAHRAWMIRAYALGVGAGTQALTGGVSMALLGTGVLRDDLAKVAGWAVNLAVAEWVIRRGAPVGARVRPRVLVGRTP